ncbi:uncharacterized protein LOC109862144 [Pseudomyrmex gracilis]|uniref:uncharacterized protein LOC109862144 n=1 Tax=Pseudomyrmex gracilis TaxID=219809 RepID=UPI00099523EB|nr:uncharacterized protein LOC109862144 [Pseudomyrmex gracilis]
MGKQMSNQRSEAKNNEDVVCNHAQTNKLTKTSQVLLSTAMVKVKGSDGQTIIGKALLDNGSQSNFVTEEFAKKLSLKFTNNQIEIKGISQHVTHAMNSVNLSMTSRFDTFEMDILCIVLPKITQSVPTFEFIKADCNIPKNIKLADPNFNLAGKIDLLLGAERFWEVICVGQIKLGKNQPVLQKSVLGGLVSGTISIFLSKQKQTSCNLSLAEDLNNTVHKFWEIEQYENSNFVTPEDEYCETHFKNNYSRQSDGKFVVKLPVKEEV